MKRWRFFWLLGYLLLFTGWMLFCPTPVEAVDKQLLQTSDAQRPPKTEFQFAIDAIDPTPDSNPKGAFAPGYRGPQQLVVYTSAFGKTTGTNQYGMEAVVINNRVERLNPSNTAIPPNGFVISGQGMTGQWLKRTIQPQAQVELNHGARKILVRLTPDIYLAEVDKAMQRADKKASIIQNSALQADYARARECTEKLKAMASQGVTPKFVEQSKKCQTLANHVFYRSVSVPDQAFRGIWVRPLEQTPEQVERAVAELKEAGIEHVFLETYFLGSTLYPSQVMAEYNLPTQHLQFQGWDPLKVWVDTAHRHGIKVHAWVETFLAGNTRTDLNTYGAILSRYPQWSNLPYTAVGSTKPIPSEVEPGHYFLDPANPEVQTFLEKLIYEIVTQYEIDGLNLDYIRYPATRPPDHSGYLASNWGYSQVSREAFQKAMLEEAKAAEAKRLEELKKAGKPLPKTPKKNPKTLEKEEQEHLAKLDPKNFTPDHPLWPRWVEWRKAQVSNFVKNISGKIQSQKSQVLVSAVVFPLTEPKSLVKLQDWPRWVAEGWVEALTPIGLRSGPEGMYQDSLAFKHLTQGKVPVYVGVFSMYNQHPPEDLISEIDAVQRAGMPGLVLFERAHLKSQYKEALLQGAFRQPEE